MPHGICCRGFYNWLCFPTRIIKEKKQILKKLDYDKNSLQEAIQLTSYIYIYIYIYIYTSILDQCRTWSNGIKKRF